MSNYSEQPTCGFCHKVMTPQNSTRIPELFVCDDCAPQVIGVAPAPPAYSSEEWGITARYADEHAAEWEHAGTPREEEVQAGPCHGECNNAGSKCYAKDGYYGCTRPKGHSGPHAACGIGEDHNLHVWETPNSNAPLLLAPGDIEALRVQHMQKALDWVNRAIYGS